MSDKQMTDIWKKYMSCRNYLDGKQIVSKTDTQWDFYNGNQWRGVQTDGRDLPCFPFIKTVCKYKVSTIAQNSLVASFNDLEHRTDYTKVCELLEKDFATMWERTKMDAKKWDIIKSACVQGDEYVFFGTDDVADMQLIANTEIMFGDEQEQDIQKQPFIILYERMLVSEAVKIAKENGVSKEEYELIKGDSDTRNVIGNKEEVKATEKVSVILYLEKKDGIVYKARSTKDCIIEPLKPIARYKDGEMDGGLRSYPIVGFVWEKLPNNARGNSEVRQLMPNQIELNKTLVRRSMSVKMTAFPRIAYDASAIENPEDLETVGASIAMNGATSNVDQMIKYLNPASMSHDAESLQLSLLNTTMELAGAQDTALGNIDPQRVSGAAIEAIRDQTALPLNEQVSAYRQFAEDLALLRYDMLYAFAPSDGVTVNYVDDEGNPLTEVIDLKTFKEFRPYVRIDVSADNSWSKYAQQQELAGLLNNGQISLEEYLEALPNNSSLPKNKLLELIERRKQNVGENVQMQEMSDGVFGPQGVPSARTEMPNF